MALQETKNSTRIKLEVDCINCIVYTALFLSEKLGFIINLLIDEFKFRSTLSLLSGKKSNEFRGIDYLQNS